MRPVPAEPIDPALLRRLAARLRDDVGRVLSAVPAPHRGVTRMSVWTGVPKPLCFRVLAAERSQADPLDVISLLPGAEGLEGTLAAVAERVSDRAVHTSAARAVETYRQLLGLLGGTQSKAKRAVSAMLRRHGAAREAGSPARKAAFESARGLTGVWSDVMSVVQAAGPAISGTHRRPTAMVTGHLGLHAGHAHLPVVFQFRNRHQVAPSFSGFDAQRSQGLNHFALIPEFSSVPFPKIITQGEPGFERDVVDWDDAALAGGRPVDVFSGIRGEEGPSEGPLESHALARIPTRLLAIDQLLPLDLPYLGPASGTGYFVGLAGTVRDEPSARWYDRLHDMPAPSDSLAAPAPFERAFPRHDELIAFVLDALGLRHDQVRHLRWLVRFPVWGADYSMRIGRNDG